MILPGDLCTLTARVLTLMVAHGHSTMMASPVLVTGLENPSPCSTYSSVLLSFPSSLAFQTCLPTSLFCEKLRLSTSPAHTLSILETTRGFLTKAIRASVLRARNSASFLHCSRSQEWHRVAERHKKDFREKLRSPGLSTGLGVWWLQRQQRDADL